MTPENLEELRAREGERVQWERQVADPVDVVRALVAFANDLANLGGGYVVCGAAEGQDEHGFPQVVLEGLSARRITEIERRVFEACRRYVSPPLSPRVEQVPATTPDRRVLVFVQPASAEAHVFRESAEESGTYWIRSGRSTVAARNGLLLDLLRRKGAAAPWDRRLAQDFDSTSLDLVRLREYLTRMGLWDPTLGAEHYLAPGNALSPFVPSLCAREGLFETARPRNFALLLFGRDVQRHCRGPSRSCPPTRGPTDPRPPPSGWTSRAPSWSRRSVASNACGSRLGSSS